MIYTAPRAPLLGGDGFGIDEQVVEAVSVLGRDAETGIIASLQAREFMRPQDLIRVKWTE